MAAFELVCEIEPATRPDLVRVRRQIGVLSAVTSRFLIPDNHIGRATVSSVAVAHEVAQMGCRAVACINARDRNLLGFRRDLLTAAAYGVGEFLFVYGDRPETGRRSDNLTVRSMIDMARDFAEEQTMPIRIGVSCGLGAVAAWKHDADAWYLQVSYDLDAIVTWRAGVEFDGAVYAGVMALPSASMARKVGADVPQLAVPRHILDRLDANPNAGIDLAVELVLDVRDSNAFDGVHLIPVNRYRVSPARYQPGTHLAIRAGLLLGPFVVRILPGRPTRVSLRSCHRSIAATARIGRGTSSAPIWRSIHARVTTKPRPRTCSESRLAGQSERRTVYSISPVRLKSRGRCISGELRFPSAQNVPLRRIGPSARSPMARSIARAVRGASGMVDDLAALRSTVSVRCPRSRPSASISYGRLGDPRAVDREQRG